MGATPLTYILLSVKINHLYLSLFTLMARKMFTAYTVLIDGIFWGVETYIRLNIAYLYR